MLASIRTLLGSAQPGVEIARLSYNRDVRPILSDRCFQCHGPDSAVRKADLRLDVREDALRDRDGFRAIDLEDPAASEILFRIESDDPDLVMPPAAIHKPLTAAEKATLARWIAEGAEYEPHWSYLAAARSSRRGSPPFRTRSTRSSWRRFARRASSLRPKPIPRRSCAARRLT